MLASVEPSAARWSRSAAALAANAHAPAAYRHSVVTSNDSAGASPSCSEVTTRPCTVWPVVGLI